MVSSYPFIHKTLDGATEINAN